jgi:protoporphyrin/coproporphyrin ferrochelatase
VSRSAEDRPVGVLVMAHGTPQHREEIGPFYTRIRRGRPPTPEQLAELERRYAEIGGLSPLAELTRAQVDGVRAALDRRAPGRYVVAYGAKHADPLIEAAAATLTAGGVRRAVGLVLTPHGSSRGSQEYFARAEAALSGSCRFVAVPPWYAEPGLVALVAARIKETLASVSAGDDPSRYPVIFTAHSVPEQAPDTGDTYPAQLAESAGLAAAAAGIDRWEVAWQSAGRTPEPWLGPDVRDAVRRLAETGGVNDVHGVVICPIGFVADHLEVLYDLDIELAAVAAQVGLSYARTASLNDDPRFISVLADVVTAAVPDEG